MQICSLNLQNNYALNKTRNLTQSSTVQSQVEQNDSVSYQKISPAQYMAMRGVSFGALFGLLKDNEAQLINDIKNLDSNDKKTLQSILKRIDNPKNDINF